MKTVLYIAAVLAVLIVGYNTRGVFTPGTVKADSVSSDKYDGDCTGHETVGRCADKCPVKTTEGVYYLQGFDKDTGAAVCGFSYYHPCPYADAQPADSAVCQKLTEEANVNQSAQSVDVTTPDVNNFVGK